MILFCLLIFRFYPSLLLVPSFCNVFIFFLFIAVLFLAFIIFVLFYFLYCVPRHCNVVHNLIVFLRACWYADVLFCACMLLCYILCMDMYALKHEIRSRGLYTIFQDTQISGKRSERERKKKIEKRKIEKGGERSTGAEALQLSLDA